MLKRLLLLVQHLEEPNYIYGFKFLYGTYQLEVILVTAPLNGTLNCYKVGIKQVIIAAGRRFQSEQMSLLNRFQDKPPWSTTNAKIRL